MTHQQSPQETYDHFLSMVARQHLENLKADPYHRYGQTLFNMLYELKPNVADQIRGTIMDPFYKENVDTKIIEHIGTLWKDSSS